MAHQWELVGRLVFAAILGSAIGLERERLSWAAGLRTHMLVCVGSALVMVVSAYGFSDVLGNGVVLDPSRVAAQVVSGVGFLGAGAILARGEVVRGLTTAASVWTVAAIGLAVGGGLYIPAIAATVIILIILAGVKPLEKRFLRDKQRRELLIVAQRGVLSISTLHEFLGYSSLKVKQFDSQQSEDDAEWEEITLTFSRLSAEEFRSIERRLRQVDGIRQIKELIPS
jgi:putative Mg2+ transporter-C (MgtC) family protein